MPIPGYPYVENYGEFDCGAAHHVWIYPAIFREKNAVPAETRVEDGQSACYFHPGNPATAICSVSGRMICQLCTTEWEGETVSFEALQTTIRKESPQAERSGRIKWDDVALVLAVFPLVFWFTTVLTAPITLFICLWFWRKGATSPVRGSRWRYVVAGALALAQIGFWVWFGLSEIGGA